VTQFGSQADLSMKSPVFPGGSLLSATFDRDLMRLSDRGGASGLIGDRWSDVCSEVMVSWPGTTVRVLQGRDVHVSRIVRLDDVPAIAHTASRKKLQNPDFIVVGTEPGGQIIFSADAKFSIETAGASQVSGESLRSLLEIGPIITEPVGEVSEDVTVEDGIFLAPDYSLTHYVMGRRHGYRSLSVSMAQIALLPVTAVGLLKPVEGSSLIPLFVGIDQLDMESRQSVLLALYYFRLVRAGIGCWYDQTGSLLVPKVKPALDLAEVREEAEGLAKDAASGWEVIQRWDSVAETVRSQRDAVNKTTAVPIVNRELREQLEKAALAEGVTPPSLNKVRRRIGSWFRDQLIEDFGPIMPPVSNFPRVLQQLDRRARELRPELDRMTTEIISAMLQEMREENPETTPSDA
jgi:hypothetical protein